MSLFQVAKPGMAGDKQKAIIHSETFGRITNKSVKISKLEIVDGLMKCLNGNSLSGGGSRF